MTNQGQQRSKWFWIQIDPGKLELFAELLRRVFPGVVVSHGPDLYPECTCYRIGEGPNSDRCDHHRVIVLREFFEENDWAAIERKFRDWHLAKIISRHLCVLITKVGPSVDRPETRGAKWPPPSLLIRAPSRT